MKLNEITLFVVIFIGMFVLVMGYTAALNAITKEKARAENRKKALSFLGKDLPVSVIRKDNGARLAYKGLMKFLEEDYQKSSELFEEALRLNLCDENKNFCFRWAAHCCLKMNQHEKYKETLFRAVQALSTDDDILVLYANCCADDGDYNNAEFYYNQALRYNPNCNYAYRALGFISETRGRYGKALEYFDTALTINEGDIDVMYEKAICHGVLGEYEKAEEFMTRAVANDDKDRYELYKKKLQNIIKISEKDLTNHERSTNLD